MILQALTRYYEDLLAQGQIDAPAGPLRRLALHCIWMKTAA